MDNQNRYGVSPLAAGITGFILGVAGVVTIAMADEETRKKAAKKTKDLKKNLLQWSDTTLQNVQQKSYDVRKDLANRIDPDVQTSVPTREKEEAPRGQTMHN